MTLTEQVTKNIIKRLLRGQDYRIEIVALINAEFLQFAIEFFKKVAQAKIDNKEIDVDWYKKTFLTPSLKAEDIAIHSGLNKKTITNMYNSATRQIVLDASEEHYDTLHQAISGLIETQSEIDLTLKIQFRKVSVELNLSESLIVINALAVKRAALRGGFWSTAGKKVEKPLMQTLCKLYEVPEANYAIRLKGKMEPLLEEEFEREIDFYLIDEQIQHKCEVKLMGKGNPESADAVIARASKVFIADKLSETNKNQLNSLQVYWVELRNELGFHKFQEVLEQLRIPYRKSEGFSDTEIENAIESVLVKIST